MKLFNLIYNRFQRNDKPSNLIFKNNQQFFIENNNRNIIPATVRNLVNYITNSIQNFYSHKKTEKRCTNSTCCKFNPFIN